MSYNMNNNKVSILVPFYNVEEYVGRCLESLFTQSYPNIEYVFVNDSTPDKSMEVIDEYIAKYGVADKCKMIIHEQNLGISASRNDCLDNMTGDYFLFVDGDDYIDKDMVELLVEAAVKGDADISGCGYVEEFADYSVEYPQKYTNDHNEMLRSITMLTIKGVLWKLLIRREVVVINDLRFPYDNSINEDYYFCCKLFYFAKSFASVDRCLYHYVQYNPNNLTRISLQNVESQAAAIQKIEEFYREKGVYKNVEKELNMRKFVSKLPLILDKTCLNVKKWRTLFPESNDVRKQMNFSIGNKIVFFLASSPFYWLVPFLRRF